MRRKLLLAVALALSLGPSGLGHAFSVGDIEVHSYLGAPFVAEVPLAMKPHERNEGFVVVIGDEQDYEAESLPRAPVLDDLWPTVIMGPPDLIRIASKEAITASAFDLVVLVRVGQITLVRRYPIMLPAPPTPSPLAATPTRKPESPPQATAATDTKPSDWMARLPETYGPVLPGESLYKIMKRLDVPKAHVWQMTVLIWRQNQSHFIRGNLHGLQSGMYLHMPANIEPELDTLPRAQAQQMIANQWDIWRHPEREQIARQDDTTPDAAPAETLTEEALADVHETVPSQAAVWPSDLQPPQVSVANLESVLQGFEERLAQRLALPTLTPEASSDTALTFVSAHELQNAIQGLETRLAQQLDQVLRQRTRLEGVGTLFGNPQPLTRALHSGVNVQTALASVWSPDSIVYVWVGQNLLLVVLAVGFAWHWYRKRA